MAAGGWLGTFLFDQTAYENRPFVMADAQNQNGGSTWFHQDRVQDGDPWPRGEEMGAWPEPAPGSVEAKGGPHGRELHLGSAGLQRRVATGCCFVFFFGHQNTTVAVSNTGNQSQHKSSKDFFPNSVS